MISYLKRLKDESKNKLNNDFEYVFVSWLIYVQINH